MVGRVRLQDGYGFIVAHMSAATDECILWPGSIATSGYAQFQYNHEHHSAHRFMCRLVHGEPPTSEHHASHSCGIRHCINPRHLSWKTPAGNMADKHVHGTYRAKPIGIEKAREIRTWQGKERADQTAARFGLTESNIRRIWDGEIWKEEFWQSGASRNRVFTPAEVLEIRSFRGMTKRGGLTTGHLAKKYGATYAQIRNIMKGETYAWVETPDRLSP